MVRSWLALGRYEAKRQEIEAWLMRMEGRSEKMGHAEAQADVLDFSILEFQQKEQKVCSGLSAQFMEIKILCSLDMDFILPPCGQFKIHALIIPLVADVLWNIYDVFSLSFLVVHLIS